MWRHLAQARIDGKAVDLYECHGVHMIRVDGLELMNGAWHESEDRLGALGASLTQGPDPAILVGGLGLGYTLASLTAHLKDRGRITVAELSADIIDWFERYVGPPALPDNVTLVHADVGTFLGGIAAWDLILLDIDNGPAAFSAAANDALYASAGLEACRKSLKPGGHLLLWSSFEDAGFVERAGAAGFVVAVEPVIMAGRAEPFHFIYVLTKPSTLTK